MQLLTTPSSRFEGLDNYNYQEQYASLRAQDGTQIQLHYIDEGPRNALPVLLMHGEPSWGYLYRYMIPGLVNAGLRVLVPDLIGFGKSDKPTDRDDYSYAAHVDWMQQWLQQVQLDRIVLFCQDWGGLIGLRLVTANVASFAGVVTANTFLPTGDVPASEDFLAWQQYSQQTENFDIGAIIQRATTKDLSVDIIDGYNAPYPDESYKAGARQFPTLVPTTPDNPESAANRAAWDVLQKFDKPFLTAFSDQDPITRGGDAYFQKLVPGCSGQQHVTINDAGHFLQEDKGVELAEVMVKFIDNNNLR